jgi:hypothetical protein
MKLKLVISFMLGCMMVSLAQSANSTYVRVLAGWLKIGSTLTTANGELNAVIPVIPKSKVFKQSISLPYDANKQTWTLPNPSAEGIVIYVDVFRMHIGRDYTIVNGVVVGLGPTVPPGCENTVFADYWE